MVGQVHKIHPIKKSRNGNLFIRVEFMLDDGVWAKTDLVPGFANYSKWKPVLKSGVGTVIKNLNYKNEAKSEIDADSKFELVVWREGVKK